MTRALVYYNRRVQVSPWDPPLASFSPRADAEYAAEPELLYLLASRARRLAGPITRELLDIAGQQLSRRELSTAIVACRSCELGAVSHAKPFAWSWHADFNALATGACARTYYMVSAVGTQFLLEPDIKVDNASPDDSVNGRLDTGVLTARTCSVLQLLAFDCTELHRAVQAPETLHGRQRYFFRLTVLG